MAVLIIIDGESGAGGAGLNADCAGAELTARTKLKILDSVTGKFQNLIVGLNNQKSHVSKTITSLGPNVGLENGLANQVHAGTFNSGNTTYLLKIGRGSSWIAEFASGYLDANGINVRSVKFQKITDCITEMHRLGLSVQPFIIFSMGINDQVIGTAGATWQTDTIAYQIALKNKIIADILAITGATVTVPLIMNKLTPDFAAFDARIETIAGPGLFVETSDLTFRESAPNRAHLNKLGNDNAVARDITIISPLI